MKKKYQELCITPLQFNCEGSLLQASIVTEEAMVTTTGQPTETFDFNDSSTFQQDWE